MICVQGLTKVHGDRVILSHVDVSVGSGERVLLLGPSGGGKTTLLRILNGLEAFSDGRVQVAGMDLPREAERETGRGKDSLLALRRKVGLVFQHCALFGHLTALQNVTLAPKLVRNLAEREARDQAMSLLDVFGVAHRAGALPERLSGGEKQRVALARAIAMRPQILLLDEPTSALDSQSRKIVMAELVRLCDEGTTLVFSSHDESTARGLATRACYLKDGALEEGDSLDTMLTRARAADVDEPNGNSRDA